MREKNKKEENNLYEPPRVEFVEVEVEKGFAISGKGDDTYDNYEFGW